MKLLRFMIRKDMAKSALISLLLALLSCAFLISVLRPSYAYGEKYMTYLKGGSETVSQDAQKLADEQNALNNDKQYDVIAGRLPEKYNEVVLVVDKNNEINDYQNNHNTGGVKQAELPVELEEKIIDFSQKNSQAGAGLDSMFSLIEGELYSQQNALKLISERVRGYSRNARRGVTDEYSLKLSNKLIEDYDSVITALEKSDKIIDTRAVDGFENYMSSEILIPFGVYLLLFSIFSSEIQSSRIKSFGITKTGVRKFSLFKLCTGFVAVIILVLIIYTVDIITLFIYDTNGFKLDMPLQYLSGFELSSANMSFGGYLVAVFAAKLVYALFAASIVMFLSMLSRKTILAGAVCLVPIFVPLYLKTTSFSNPAVDILTGNYTNMLNDTGYMNFWGIPAREYVVYFAIIFIMTAFFVAGTYLLAERQVG